MSGWRGRSSKCCGRDEVLETGSRWIATDGLGLRIGCGGGGDLVRICRAGGQKTGLFDASGKVEDTSIGIHKPRLT